MYGPPPTPAATWRLASSPRPFVQVCGVNQRSAGERELGDRPGAKHPAGQDDVLLVDVERVGVERRERLGKVRVISPPAMRTPGAAARSASQPSQIRAGERLLEPQHVVRRRARTAISRAVSTSIAGVVSPGIRQPWLRSTMIAIESPTAARVAATAARPSSRPSRIDPDLHRAEALLSQAQRRLRPCGRRAAASRTRHRPGCRRSRRRRTSRRAARRPGRRCPRGRPRAASSGRRGSRSSPGPGRGARWPADPARRTGARRPRTRPSCRPTRCRRRPRRSRRARS